MSNGGRDSKGIAGSVRRRDRSPYPRRTYSPWWRKLGLVKIVKPAYRIRTVAVPINRIDPRLVSVGPSNEGNAIQPPMSQSSFHFPEERNAARVHAHVPCAG